VFHPRYPRNLREGDAQCAPLGLQPRCKSGGSGRWIVAKERRHGSELGCHRLGLALFPVGIGLDPNPHSGGCFPLEKAKLPATLLEMFAQSMGVFGIILCSEGFKGEGRLTAKGHRTNESPSPR